MGYLSQSTQLLTFGNNQEGARESTDLNQNQINVDMGDRTVGVGTLEILLLQCYFTDPLLLDNTEFM